MKVSLSFVFTSAAFASDVCTDGSCSAKSTDETTMLQGLNKVVHTHKHEAKHTTYSRTRNDVPLWAQNGGGHVKCNDNVNLICVDSQADCQEEALSNGHPYYSFRHNLATNNECNGQHKCFSSAACDHWEGRNNEWQIYTASHFTTVVSWPEWAWAPFDVAEKGPLVKCTAKELTADPEGTGDFFTSCCTEDGVGMDRDCGTTRNTNFHTAEEQCAAQGGRLCTAEEVVAVDNGTGRRNTATQGCQVDGPQAEGGANLNRLWTSTPCVPHYVTVVGWPDWAWGAWDDSKGPITKCLAVHRESDPAGSGDMFTSCCTHDGVGMSRRCADTRNSNFASAEQQCSELGGRLCTAEEARDTDDARDGRHMTATQGCQVDGPQGESGSGLNRLWTSTSCIPTEHFCQNGVASPSGLACCAASCGTCGGPGCGSRPGGTDNCCHQHVTGNFNDGTTRDFSWCEVATDSSCAIP